LDFYENVKSNLKETSVKTKSIALTGTNEITAPTGYYIFLIIPSSDMVIADQTEIEDTVNADLSSLTSIPAGYQAFTNLSAVTLTSGEGIAYLSVL